MSLENKPVETIVSSTVRVDTTDAPPVAPPPAVPVVADTIPSFINADAADTSASAANTSNWKGTMRRHFNNTNKYVRDKWVNAATLTRNHTTRMAYWPGKVVDADALSPLLLIPLIITLLAIPPLIVALTTSWWSCDTWTGEHFGLWNTCWQVGASELPPIAAGEQTTIIVKKQVHKVLPFDLMSNETTLFSLMTNATTTTAEPPTISSVWKCTEQSLGHVATVPADKIRVDHNTYSQGLMVSGAVLYVLSWFAIIWAWWWMRSVKSGTAAPAWLNSVRNILTFAVLAQIFSFILEIVGLFLFIWSDRFSTSIVLLFIYFGIAIVSTNITNFITIEYKIFKQRHIIA